MTRIPGRARSDPKIVATGTWGLLASWPCSRVFGRPSCASRVTRDRVTDQDSGRRDAVARPSRMSPTPLVGSIAVLVYIVVVFGLQLSSGIPYAGWTSTTAHTVRAAVNPLAVGSVLLIAFLAYARWDIVWHNPERLKTTTAMKIAMGLFIVLVVIRLDGVDYASASVALVLVVCAHPACSSASPRRRCSGACSCAACAPAGRTEAHAALCYGPPSPRAVPPTPTSSSGPGMGSSHRWCWQEIGGMIAASPAQPRPHPRSDDRPRDLGHLHLPLRLAGHVGHPGVLDLPNRGDRRRSRTGCPYGGLIGTPVVTPAGMEHHNASS